MDMLRHLVSMDFSTFESFVDWGFGGIFFGPEYSFLDDYSTALEEMSLFHDLMMQRKDSSETSEDDE
jgi:hypothetical protein